MFPKGRPRDKNQEETDFEAEKNESGREKTTHFGGGEGRKKPEARSQKERHDSAVLFWLLASGFWLPVFISEFPDPYCPPAFASLIRAAFPRSSRM